MCIRDRVTEVLALAGSIPVIVLTGNADVDFSIRSISYGVSDYLVKDNLSADTLYKSILYSIERKKIYKQLKESEERFSTLFQLSPQPMYVYDPETSLLVQVNKAAAVFFGYTQVEMKGMSILELVYDGDTGMAMEMMKDVMADTSDSYAEQIRFRKKSGEMMYVELFGTSILLEMCIRDRDRPRLFHPCRRLYSRPPISPGDRRAVSGLHGPVPPAAWRETAWTCLLYTSRCV